MCISVYFHSVYQLAANFSINKHIKSLYMNFHHSITNSQIFTFFHAPLPPKNHFYINQERKHSQHAVFHQMVQHSPKYCLAKNSPRKSNRTAIGTCNSTNPNRLTSNLTTTSRGVHQLVFMPAVMHCQRTHSITLKKY
jgi:hypothetical protein